MQHFYVHEVEKRSYDSLMLACTKSSRKLKVFHKSTRISKKDSYTRNFARYGCTMCYIYKCSKNTTSFEALSKVK